MDGHAIYEHRNAKNNHFLIDFAISTLAFWMDGQADQPTDGPTNGQTNPLVEMR